MTGTKESHPFWKAYTYVSIIAYVVMIFYGIAMLASMAQGILGSEGYSAFFLIGYCVLCLWLISKLISYTSNFTDMNQISFGMKALILMLVYPGFYVCVLIAAIPFLVIKAFQQQASGR